MDEIAYEVTLHFFHRSLVAQHRLQPAKGMILYGPPGCGKTMIAKALANYLACLQGITARFLNVKPCVHRSSWYGETEENIRELFALARKVSEGHGKFANVTFDDIEQ